MRFSIMCLTVERSHSLVLRVKTIILAISEVNKKKTKLSMYICICVYVCVYIKFTNISCILLFVPKKMYKYFTIIRVENVVTYMF